MKGLISASVASMATYALASAIMAAAAAGMQDGGIPMPKASLRAWKAIRPAPGRKASFRMASWPDGLPGHQASARQEGFLQDGLRISGRHLFDLHAARRRGHEYRSEEHTSELQSLRHLVCRLL